MAVEAERMIGAALRPLPRGAVSAGHIFGIKSSAPANRRQPRPRGHAVLGCAFAKPRANRLAVAMLDAPFG